MENSKDIEPSGVLPTEAKQSEERPVAKEKHQPDVEINIFYSAHGVGENVAMLASLFKRADIFFPEYPSWTSTSLVDFQDLSAGEISADEMLSQYGWDRKSPPWFTTSKIRLVEKSKKAIGFVDLPFGHPLEMQLENSRKKYKSRLASARNFDQMLEATLANLKDESSLARAREEHVASQIDSEIDRIFKLKPSLKRKQKVNVLLDLGGAHTYVAHILKSKGFNIARHFGSLNRIQTLRNEALRRLAFNRDVDKKFLASVLLEQEFSETDAFTVLSDVIGVNTKVLQTAVRRIAESFSIDDVKNIFEQKNNPFYIQRLFLSLLGEEAPYLKQTLDAYLQSEKAHKKTE